MDAIITFPKSFLWGVSSASYQVEGGNRNSALWAWEKKKGWERSGEATNSWDLFPLDMALLRRLNMTSYRFSVEWSRVEPEPGRFDQAALDRYVSWARQLKDAGIRPFVCLHHFSEPAWLLRECPNGWLDPKTPGYFLEYVERTARALGESVSDWITINEPNAFLAGAYGVNYFPPGRLMFMNVGKTFNPVLVKAMARAHRQVYELLHADQPGCQVGIAQHITTLEPARSGDERAVRDWDWFMHRHFLDEIADRMDYLGINYYTRIYVHRTWAPFFPMGVVAGYADVERRLGKVLFRLAGGRLGSLPKTGMGWEVFPEGLGQEAFRLWETYRKPIYITENGMAAAPGISREDYIREHLKSLAGAMAKGADVRGYYYWSMLDNYEWGSYKPRFGLFSRRREPAAGCDYYASVAKTGRI